MSKTKGNVLDPIEIVKQYGTDAVRFTLASMASPGTDIAFNVARTEGYRAFANKIWNAARFLFMNVDRAAEIGIVVDPATLGGIPTASADAPLESRWIIAELHVATAKVNQSLENYRYDDAANTIYQYFWGCFCDWYLEFAKRLLDFSETADKAKTTTTLNTLMQVFEASLRLLSPFMPFLTEEIWHALYESKAPFKSIALSNYPSTEEKQAIQVAYGFSKDLFPMRELQNTISALRAERKARNVPEKEIVPAKIYVGQESPYLGSLLFATGSEANIANVNVLSKVILEPSNQLPPDGVQVRSEVGFDVQIEFEQKVDVPAERERLIKDIAKFEKGVAAAARQLGNEGFLAKAPAQVVEGLKKQEAETRLLLEKALAALAALPTG
jgi:valyl-tRNA synthetase